MYGALPVHVISLGEHQQDYLQVCVCSYSACDHITYQFVQFLLIQNNSLDFGCLLLHHHDSALCEEHQQLQSSPL